MFNTTKLLIHNFANQLRENYRRTYGGLKPDYADILVWVGQMALENIANSDALYHNVEHTMLVTLAGQEILHGKHIREGGVSCEDWLHVTIALLCHDIGFLKGLCHQDNVTEGLYATGIDDEMVELPTGCTDARLTPYHVDRGKLFVDERFGNHKLINTDVIKRYIELTRFPVPMDEEHQDTANYPGLVRAADLIGQMSDPRYLQKMSALFYEFEETGMNQILGYHTPGDLRRSYPDFYWNVVYHYIRDALIYLEVTQEGKQILANLYANVFRSEHEPPNNRVNLSSSRQNQPLHKLKETKGQEDIDRSHRGVATLRLIKA